MTGTALITILSDVTNVTILLLGDRTGVLSLFPQRGMPAYRSNDQHHITVIVIIVTSGTRVLLTVRGDVWVGGRPWVRVTG